MTETSPNLSDVTITIHFPDGKTKAVKIAADPIPDAVQPGEFIGMPVGGTYGVYLLVDKGWSLVDDSKWQKSLSVAPYDPNGKTEEETAEFRRSQLKRFGWIG